MIIMNDPLLERGCFSQRGGSSQIDEESIHDKYNHDKKVEINIIFILMLHFST